MTTTMTRFGMLVAMVVLAACGAQPSVTQLQLVPPQAQVVEGMQANVQAVAVYSDGTQRDVTAEVQWSSGAEAVAAAAAGRIAGLTPGLAELTASWSGRQATAQVEVLAARLLSMRVTVAAASLPAGRSTQASATGAFSNGRELDVTASVTWGVGGDALEVDAAGTVRAANLGQGDVVASFGDVSGSATVLVTDAVVEALRIEGVATSMPQGLSAPVQVWATYSDGTELDVTGEATLDVADASVATVDGAIRILAAGTRELRALATGSTLVRAAFGDQTTSVAVEVTPVALVSLEVFPPHGSVHTGNIYGFTAKGTYSNGDVLVVTDQVTWTTADDAYAVVYDFLGVPGSILARAVGTVAVTATFPGTAISADHQWVIAH